MASLNYLEKEKEMVAKKKATTGKGQVKKLKLKRETLRDLEVKKEARMIKGGNVKSRNGYYC